MPAPQCQCGLRRDHWCGHAPNPKGTTQRCSTGLAGHVENPLPLLPHCLKGMQQLSWSGQRVGRWGERVENWKAEGAVSLTNPF